jgi:metacaspase-1
MPTIISKRSMRRDAVCMGINVFSALPHATLGGCVADAKTWRGLWQWRGFDDVRLYVDAQALKEVAKEELTRLVMDAKTDDEKVFQLSSHGTWDVDREGDENDRRDEAFCFHDLAQRGPLTDDEISVILNKSRKRFRMLLIMDTCHSGTSSRMLRLRQSPALQTLTKSGVRLPRAKYLSPAEWLGDRRAAKFERDAIAAGSVKIIARNTKPLQRALAWNACQDEEFAYDSEFNGQPNGAFTFFAVRALREQLEASPQAKAPTMQEVHRAIRAYLPADVYPQMPNLYGTRTMYKWRVFGAAA